jgi:hydrogenase nickel incorporation protein HypB
MSIITVERKIFEKNDDIARDNRQFFRQRNIQVLNLVSSPGSGKTTLLEKTLEHLKTRLPVAVIEGDVQTDRDAQRIARHGVPVVQIITHGGCHLDASLVKDALQKLDLTGVRILFIENVGNLVCPANYDLGEDDKIIVLSTTEGDDKPLKYPHIFRTCTICVINKIDLLPYVDFDMQAMKRYALQINPQLAFFELAASTGEGMEHWLEWLERRGGL